MVSPRQLVLFILIMVDIVDPSSVSQIASTINPRPCAIGFIGQNCSISCRYPSYGEDCQKNCNCFEVDCDAETGCKDGSPTVSPELSTTTMNVRLADRKTSSDCPSGYMDSDCNISCRYPSFGAGCQAMCNCSEELCNHIRGCKEFSTNDCASEKGSSHDAMLYSIVVLCLWTVIQLSVYFYILFYFKSGSYGNFL